MMKQDQIIATSFAVCCLAAMLFQSASAPWDAVLFDGESYYLIELGNSPLWNRPNTPDYREFRERFDSLRTIASRPPQIEAAVDWWSMIGRMIGTVWVISLVFALANLIAPELRSNVVLLLAEIYAYSLVIAFVLSIVYWIIFGGWGPPSPLTFAFLVFVVGTFWGFMVLRR